MITIRIEKKYLYRIEKMGSQKDYDLYLKSKNCKYFSIYDLNILMYIEDIVTKKNLRLKDSFFGDDLRSNTLKYLYYDYFYSFNGGNLLIECGYYRHVPELFRPLHAI